MKNILNVIFFDDNLLFEFDMRKSESNLQKHGIDFAEAQVLFSDPRIVCSQTSRNRERRTVALARHPQDGSMWSVSFVLRGSRCIRIISVRRATKEEVSLYDKAAR